MKRTVYIGAGSFIGAIARYMLKSVHIWNFSGHFPLNTLLINLTGSFFLSLILTVALSVREFDPDIKLGLTVGFLGAFTTFSALCRETVDLLGRGDYFFALAYMILSVVLGLLGAYAGISLIRGMFKETLLQRKERPESDENQTT